MKPPTTSPYIFQAADYLGRRLSVTFIFDNANRTIIAALTHRDADCFYEGVLTGVNVDGSPTSITRQLAIPEGDDEIALWELQSRNIVTIDDLFKYGMAIPDLLWQL
jgi:hypothetical protein